MDMLAVHEEVDDGTGEQEKPEESAEDVGFVFFPQEVHGDRRDQASGNQ
jgi:hypothetical protein